MPRASASLGEFVRTLADPGTRDTLVRCGSAASLAHTSSPCRRRRESDGHGHGHPRTAVAMPVLEHDKAPAPSVLQCKPRCLFHSVAAHHSATETQSVHIMHVTYERDEELNDYVFLFQFRILLTNVCGLLTGVTLSHKMQTCPQRNPLPALVRPRGWFVIRVFCQRAISTNLIPRTIGCGWQTVVRPARHRMVLSSVTPRCACPHVLQLQHPSSLPSALLGW